MIFTDIVLIFFSFCYSHIITLTTLMFVDNINVYGQHNIIQYIWGFLGFQKSFPVIIMTWMLT